MHDYWSSIVNPGYPMQDINSGTKSSPVPKDRKPGFKSLEVGVLIILPLPFLLLPFSIEKVVEKVQGKSDFEEAQPEEHP
jgi:hypothetical protein